MSQHPRVNAGIDVDALAGKQAPCHSSSGAPAHRHRAHRRITAKFIGGGEFGAKGAHQVRNNICLVDDREQPAERASPPALVSLVGEQIGPECFHLEGAASVDREPGVSRRQEADGITDGVLMSKQGRIARIGP